MGFFAHFDNFRFRFLGEGESSCITPSRLPSAVVQCGRCGATCGHTFFRIPLQPHPVTTHAPPIRTPYSITNTTSCRAHATHPLARSISARMPIGTIRSHCLDGQEHAYYRLIAALLGTLLARTPYSLIYLGFTLVTHPIDYLSALLLVHHTRRYVASLH